VFGPGERFPFAPERKYTPCDASKEKLWALRDYLGFERNVLVQATCHGADNRAVVDALRTAGDRARGVATITTATTDAELAELDAAGVRGARFNFVKRLVDVTPPDVLAVLARRIAALGWHVVVYFEAPICPISRISFASCQRPSSSITWDAPMSRNRLTAPSSNASCS
jgi:2-pyrone-4,6-dicarboxylate lactonase